MIYITQVLYIAQGHEKTFDEFEEFAIPIILKYNGKLLLRIRPTESSFIEANIDKPYEIHIVQFETEQDFLKFNKDKEREKYLHFKNKSITATLVLRGIKL